MSGLKNMSRGGYIVVGIVMALILVPSGVAAALAYTGIEGSSGHVANVSDAGQLLTTEANPSSFFQNSDAVLSTSKLIRIATPSPSADALVVTTIHFEVGSDPTPGDFDYIETEVVTGTTCGGSKVGTYTHVFTPPTIGEYDISLAPGLAIPQGDSLCGDDSHNLVTEADVSGYTVPSADVP